MAVPTEQENAAHRDDPVAVSTAFHFDIDSERTLDAFEARFKDKDRGLFRSASEICDMDLYPMPNGGGRPTGSRGHGLDALLGGNRHGHLCPNG
jgi:hypothetical protein